MINKVQMTVEGISVDSLLNDHLNSSQNKAFKTAF